MGMKVAPKWNDPRTDIVQTVTFGEPDPMVKFCAAIQHYSPMNSFVDQAKQLIIINKKAALRINPFNAAFILVNLFCKKFLINDKPT